MYLAVDIGGTKTLIASLDTDGNVVEKIKFPTPKDYQQFLAELASNVANLTAKDFSLAEIGVPGRVNRQEGLVYALGNLPWRDAPIGPDVSRILRGVPTQIENDARLGGLAEAVPLSHKYRRILFLTISTGIGGALIEDGKIVKALEDVEMGKMPLIFDGKPTAWEDFAGGRPLVAKYGKLAREITDPQAWQDIGQNIAYGVGVACAFLMPQVIVFGGGVGQFINRFRSTVESYLEKELHPEVKRPEALLEAHHKEDGVIYGCYELIKQSQASAAQQN